MTTTPQQIRDIIKCNREVLGIETTKDMIINGHYVFLTDNVETIERAYYAVRKELMDAEETERRIKYEFRGIAIAIAITFFVIGMAVGGFLF